MCHVSDFDFSAVMPLFSHPFSCSPVFNVHLLWALVVVFLKCLHLGRLSKVIYSNSYLHSHTDGGG